MNLDYSKLGVPRIENIAAIPWMTYGLQQCKLTFETSTNQDYALNVPEVRVVQYETSDTKQKEMVSQYPDLLGLDVLSKFRICFENDVVILDTKD